MIQLAVIPDPTASLVLTPQACRERPGRLPLSAPDPISVCVLQLPTNSPAPGCRGGPIPGDLEGRGYYNLQNRKLRMNKSRVACHF